METLAGANIFLKTTQYMQSEKDWLSTHGHVSITVLIVYGVRKTYQKVI